MRRLMLMMLLVGTIAAAAAAQETTATITGVVTDQTGAVVPGVTVTLKNTNTDLARSTVTNGAGLYTATQLPIGTYEVSFDVSGFQPVTFRSVVLHVNDRQQLD